MSLLLMQRGGVVSGGGGGGGGPFPLTVDSEFVNSSEFEHSSGAFVDTDILLAMDFSRGFGYKGNAEGKIEGASSAAPNIRFTGSPTDSANLDDTQGNRGTIFSDAIPQNSTEWEALGMDGELVKAITWGRGTDYAFTYGVHSGAGGDYSNYMFDHRLPSGGDAADGGWLTTVHRFERWFPSDYSFGAEKIYSLNQPGADAGIMWGNLHINLGAGSSSSTGNLAWQGITGAGGTSPSYSGLATLERNHIYEFVLVMGLASGVLQIYCTDLGTPGAVSIPGSRTLVRDESAYDWQPLNGTSTGLGVVWPESWANPVSATSEPGGSLFTNWVVRKGTTLPPIREAA